MQKDKLRVIQWTTGKVGRLAMRAILDDPRLELVGVFAHSDDKVGVDAGKLCDRPDTGILATNNVDQLLALKADTVIYTPFTGDVEHTVKLLENGADVISTNLFFHVGGIQGEVRDQFEAACQRGNSSFHITGINPGWINSITAALTAICRRVDSVSIYESADCTMYESVETWSYLGMGQMGATQEIKDAAKTWLVMFRDAIVRVGDALDFKFDDFEFYVDYARAAEKVDLGWFCMEKGSNAALRAGWNGKIDGRTVVKGQITWYLTKNLIEGWDIDDDEYHLVVEGEPGVDTRISIVPPADWTIANWDTVTAMPTVNVAFDVKAARPGVLTLRDVGLPYAPAGLWPR